MVLTRLSRLVKCRAQRTAIVHLWVWGLLVPLVHISKTFRALPPFIYYGKVFKNQLLGGFYE